MIDRSSSASKRREWLSYEPLVTCDCEDGLGQLVATPELIPILERPGFSYRVSRDRLPIRWPALHRRRPTSVGTARSAPLHHSLSQISLAGSGASETPMLGSPGHAPAPAPTGAHGVRGHRELADRITAGGRVVLRPRLRVSALLRADEAFTALARRSAERCSASSPTPGTTPVVPRSTSRREHRRWPSAAAPTDVSHCRKRRDDPCVQGGAPADGSRRSLGSGAQCRCGGLFQPGARLAGRACARFADQRSCWRLHSGPVATRRAPELATAPSLRGVRRRRALHQLLHRLRGDRGSSPPR